MTEKLHSLLCSGFWRHRSDGMTTNELGQPCPSCTPCVCEHVDIGIGLLKVSDDPSCRACHPYDADKGAITTTEVP